MEQETTASGILEEMLKGLLSDKVGSFIII